MLSSNAHLVCSLHANQSKSSELGSDRDPLDLKMAIATKLKINQNGVDYPFRLSMAMQEIIDFLVCSDD